MVTEGADAQLTDSTLLGAVRGEGPGERGALGLVVDSATLKAHRVASVAARAGVEVQGTGALDMSSSLILATRSAPVMYEDGHWLGLGIVVASRASLTLAASTVQDVRTIGLLVTGTAAVTETLVRGTRPAGGDPAGRGISAQNGGKVTMNRSALVDNAEAGIIVMLGGSALAMNDSTVQATGADRDNHFGVGVLLGGDASGVVDRSTITGSQGIGLAVAAAGATVSRTTISRNAVGVHAQDGSSLREGEPTGDALSLTVSRDTRFVANGTRVGTGVVPLPAVLAQPLP
jgi:hypothetical protein